MNKKIFLLFIFLFLIINSINTFASLCYQESANDTTICGGLATGNYSCEGTWDPVYICPNVYDGNWDIYGSVEPPGGPGYQSGDIYVNYTKPANVLNTSLWQIKDQEGRFKV